MNIIEREYHRFGPWLLEIKNLIELPQQYIGYKDMILSAAYSFKVPVNNDRIKMQPGMLLYKEVVCVFGDRLIILSMSDYVIHENIIMFKDIKYIIQGGELLSRYINIATNEIEHKISFNSVSQDVTSIFLEKLRFGMANNPSDNKIEVMDYRKYLDNALYKMVLSTETSDTRLDILAHQPSIKVKAISVSKFENYLGLFKKHKLHETLFLTNHKELIIASGDLDRKKSGTVDYSHRHIYVDFNDVDYISKDPNAVYENVINLTIHIGDKKIQLKVHDDLELDFLEKVIGMAKE